MTHAGSVTFYKKVQILLANVILIRKQVFAKKKKKKGMFVFQVLI